MGGLNTDKLRRGSSGTRPVVTTLSLPMAAIDVTAVLSDATGWNNITGLDVTIFRKQLNSAGTGYEMVPGSQTDWVATLAGNTLSAMNLRAGSVPSGGYAADGLTVVKSGPNAAYADDIYAWGSAHANQDGSLKAAAVQTALGLGAGALNGWNALGFTPNSVTALGNRSYSLVFNGTDQTGTLSPGMRIRTTRTVAAPTQCTTLNGTNQYWNRSATINGMTFTDNFTVSGWVKLSSYAQGVIMSRYNGTSGWVLRTTAAGQIEMYGFNAGAGNYRGSQSYQSLPLNKWVHVAFSLGGGMTSGLLYIDGVLVPTSAQSGGTLPSALIQAGNLEVGSWNGGTLLFPGKVAQAAVFSAVLSQATIQAQISQGLAGTETSLISAYSFNGNANDLNTTNANNLTSNNGAAATTADSFNGAQANGTISSTLDYGIVESITFSTNTTVIVQVPEGCTIPTSGGVSAVAYSGVKAPYGMPIQKDKWDILVLAKADLQATGLTTSTWFGLGATGQLVNINVPAGAWNLSYQAMGHVIATSSTYIAAYLTLTTTNGSETDAEFSGFPQATNTASSENFAYLTKNKNITTTVLTPYYMNIKSNNAGIGSLNVTGTQTVTYIKAENAYL
jgi:hypothetical protein